MLHVLRKLMAAHQAVFDVARFGGISEEAQKWAVENHKAIDDLAWAVIDLIKAATGKTQEEIVREVTEANNEHRPNG